MTYNPNNFTEKVIPSAGTRVEAVIIKITEGSISDFVKGESAANWGETARPAIEITAGQAINGDPICRRIVTLPKDNSIAPGSILAKWKQLFGGYPSVGQRVFLVSDGMGYRFPV